MKAERRRLELRALLRMGEELTTSRLAQKLGVSRRTLLRDLRALADEGVPIQTQAGVGGGVRMDTTRERRSVELSLAEIVSLWLATQLALGSVLLPWSKASRSALSKLMLTLPERRILELKRLAKRIYIGPSASERVRASDRKASSGVLEAVESSLTAGISLEFRYEDAEGRSTERHVEPHGLLVQTPLYYLLALDLNGKKVRTFRLDRMLRARPNPSHRFQVEPAVIRSQLPDESFRPLRIR